MSYFSICCLISFFNLKCASEASMHESYTGKETKFMILTPKSMNSILASLNANFSYSSVILVVKLEA